MLDGDSAELRWRGGRLRQEKERGRRKQRCLVGNSAARKALHYLCLCRSAIGARIRTFACGKGQFVVQGFPKDQLVDLPRALAGNSRREIRAKPKSNQV